MARSEEELLERTRTYMRQMNLVEGFGLGRTWAIVSSITEQAAPYPRERYEETILTLKFRWPEDVHELVEPRVPPRFTRHICLRVGSPAMDAYRCGDIN